MSSRRLGGGLKTDSGASAPVLPPLFFSTRQVFILTTLNKLLFMVKTLSWNQTMANKFRKSFAILLYLIRQKTVGFYSNPPTYFIEFVISLQRLNLPSLLPFAEANGKAAALASGQCKPSLIIRQFALANKTHSPFRFSEAPHSLIIRHRLGLAIR
jgi:hypothetical protein